MVNFIVSFSEGLGDDAVRFLPLVSASLELIVVHVVLAHLGDEAEELELVGSAHDEVPPLTWNETVALDLIEIFIVVFMHVSASKACEQCDCC